MRILKIKRKLIDQLPIIIALSSLTLLVLFSLQYTSYKRGQWEKDVRKSLLEVLIGKKSRLEKALSSRIYYTKGIAAFISVNPDATNDQFYLLAEQLIQKDTLISTMALSKDCILNAIYPLEGHEAALGLDLCAHPKRFEIVQKTIETRKTFVAGPVELVEGGVAFISYTPIFTMEPGKEEEFWGVTDIVIYKDKLLNEAGFNLVENGFNFALRGYDGKGDEGAVFWGEESVFDKDPVKINIDLPAGSWVLAATPVNGWGKFRDQDKTLELILLICSMIISLLFWLVIRYQVKIRNNERELKAVMGSLHNLILEFDSDGRCVKIAPTKEKRFFKPENELQGKTMQDISNREMADHFKQLIHQCLEEKDLVTTEYSLLLDEKKYWFSARLSYKSEDSVILNATDITSKKRDEEKIRHSEHELKELNTMKDKLFSIIAHDLRGPIGSFKNMVDLLLDDFDNHKKKEFFEVIQVSTTNIYSLLENLLEWANPRKHTVELNPEAFSLNQICCEVIESLTLTAKSKDIQLQNSVAEELIANCDPNMTKSILRNLLSNAIKFTHAGGDVKVEADEVFYDNKFFLQVNINDTGVGISPEKIKSLFRLDVNTTSFGTKNEKGSGLGLLLCKEFVEKQGGQLTVESEEGKGTVVSFTLPAQSLMKEIKCREKFVAQ